MDPNATLLAILDAIYNDDLAEMAELTSDLRAWINNGGFQPEWLSVLDHFVSG